MDISKHNSGIMLPELESWLPSPPLDGRRMQIAIIKTIGVIYKQMKNVGE